MAKLTLADLASLTNETSAISTINANNALIEAALEKTLSRDGTSPNGMSANLDMDGNRILNLPAPSADTEPLRKVDVEELLEDVEAVDAAVEAAEAAQLAAEQAESSAEGHAATASEAAEDAAEVLAEFETHYLGAFDADPTLDNEGNALIAGALYFNTSSNEVKVYSGSLWLDVSPSEVISVFGRTGVVLAAAGDYDAEEITFTPAGTLEAENVQDALEELDTDIQALDAAKADTGHNHDSTYFKTFNVQTFTSSGTYTPTAGMKFCRIRVQAPGGGGGGADGIGFNQGTIAGGGGGGEYAEGFFSAATIGSSQTVTIGAVGTAGSTSGGNGGTGGTTGITGLITAVGGGGGEGSGSNSTDGGGRDGGVGGTGGTGGFLRIRGHDGWGSQRVSDDTTFGVGRAGYGGHSFMGGGERSRFSNWSDDASFDGGAGYSYGGGGGGAQSNSTSGENGGAGGPGIVIIEEFI